MTITEQQFEQATGRKPVDDDMERVNCDRAGEPGHSNCGWNHTHNCPAYERSIVPAEEKQNWK